jgi:rSAM/selenodomain-associated transferase 1
MAERGHASGGAATLAVLAKAPVAGFAKTRLAPRLGAAGAAELQAVLLERTLRTAAASGFGRVAVWCAPHRRAPPFDGLSAAGALELHDQPEGDLGARMQAAFERHLAPGRPVVIIGTDSPELGPGHLARARAVLDGGADAVLLPAQDGGYAALGLARLDASLFRDVGWGGGDVLATTRDRLRRLGWSAEELAPVRDVDVPADLDWLLASGLLSEGERARLAPYLGGGGRAGGEAGVDSGREGR